MVLEKMIDELYELSKNAIASGIHVSFEKMCIRDRRRSF